MIVFNLICSTCEIEFEGWFDSSSDFQEQKRKKLINCPSCNSLSVTKSLMTPNLSSKSNIKKTPRLKKAMVNDIKKYKKIIEKNIYGVDINSSSIEITKASIKPDKIPGVNKGNVIVLNAEVLFE